MGGASGGIGTGNDFTTIKYVQDEGCGLALVAYAWADQSKIASYTPSTIYSYNSSGGAITATRSDTGSYNMTFEGLGGNSQSGRHVQVTSYGKGNTQCKVLNWDSSGADFSVNVRCYDGVTGKPADSMYTILVIWWESSPKVGFKGVLKK